MDTFPLVDDAEGIASPYYCILLRVRKLLVVVVVAQTAFRHLHLLPQAQSEGTGDYGGCLDPIMHAPSQPLIAV